MAQQPNIITTPKGIALYPWLSTPDTKFSEEGEYKVNLVLSKEDAQPIVDEINRVFAIFDAKGTTMTESNIWGGSEIRVNGTIAPYFTSMVGAGIALRLRAVQVIRLVEGGEGASRFGFDETSGYVHNAPDAGAEVFDEPSAPETIMEATPAGKAKAIARNPDVEFVGNAADVVPMAEPEVVKTVSTNDGSKDIADIVSKWGAKA